MLRAALITLISGKVAVIRQASRSGTWLAAKSAASFSNAAVPGNSWAVCPFSPEAKQHEIGTRFTEVQRANLSLYRLCRDAWLSTPDGDGARDVLLGMDTPSRSSRNAMR